MTKPLAVIIEDDPKLADIFSITLQSADFETKTIQDGQNAVPALSELKPALIVLDLHLPNVSGEDVLAHIREDDRLSGSRIILATADALMADRLRSKADLVLLKPISVNQLREMAKRMLPNDAS